MITREAKIIDFNKAFFPVEERTDLWCDFKGKHVRISGYKSNNGNGDRKNHVCSFKQIQTHP